MMRVNKSLKKSSLKDISEDDVSMDKKLEEMKLDTSIAKEKTPILKILQKNQGFKGYFKAKKFQKSSKTKDYEESKSNIEDEGEEKGRLKTWLILTFKYREYRIWRTDRRKSYSKVFARSSRCNS